MSTYFNAAETVKFDIRDFQLPTFAISFLKYLKAEKNVAPSTIFNYAVSLRTFLRWVKAVELRISKPDEIDLLDVSDVSLSQIAYLTTNDIYDFIYYCQIDRNNGADSRATKLIAIRTMYDYLIKRDDSHIVKSNPAADISPPKQEKHLPVYLTLSEAKALLNAVDGPAASRDYCILLWFLSCGMRLSELVAIDLDHIKGDTLRLHGKGRKERVLHLNEPCMEALDRYLLDRNEFLKTHEIDDKQALFISLYHKKSSRLTGRRVEQIVDKYIKKANLAGQGFSAHKLRHTAATVMYRDAGAGLLEIQEILGHQSTQTTSIYTHVSGEMTKTALDTLGSLLDD